VESDLDFPCPTCQSEGYLKLLSMSSEIPYFGEHTQITISCEKCGMKQTDFIPEEERGAISCTLSIEKEEHLQARVVRGSSGTLRIPELDLEVSPGTQSSGYVSNVEGVLNRFIDIIRMMMRQISSEIDNGEDSNEENLDKLFQLEMALTALAKGELLGELSLQILDPKGHSIIGHDDMVKKELSAEEVAQLDPGPAPIIMGSEDVE